MKTTRIFLLAVMVCCLAVVNSSNAQVTAIALTSEKSYDNSVGIYADSRLFGDHTVKIVFTTLDGYKMSGGTAFRNTVFCTVSRGKREILKLVLDKTASRWGFSYTYSYYTGEALKHRPKDTAFLYLLPGTKDKSVMVSAVSNIEDRFGAAKTQPDFFATGFTYHLGDTVCAARGGVIINVNDTAQRGDKSTEVFRSDRNRLVIQHKDGTMGSYVFRSPVHLLVSEGDEVIPGQPVGFFEKPGDHLEVMFHVNYLDEKKLIDLDKFVDSDRKPSSFTYLHPVFCNDYSGMIATPLAPRNSYVVTHPAKIVGAEMTKKERKKYGIAD